MAGDGGRAGEGKHKKRKQASIISPEDILERVRCLKARRGMHHTCVHIFVPYSRMTGAIESQRFIEAMPTYSGWRAAWLRLRKVVTTGAKSNQVLMCDVTWHNGSTHSAFMTPDGDLFMSFNAENNALFPAEARISRQQVPVSVSHELFLDEIESGRRGIVFGEVQHANNRRRVSHILSRTLDGNYSCALFRKNGQPRQAVEVSSDECKEYAPQLVEEYQWRTSKSIREDQGRLMVPFLTAFFEKAYENDGAVRRAIHLALTGEPSGVDVADYVQERLESEAASLAALDVLSSSLRELAEARAKRDPRAGELHEEEMTTHDVGFPNPKRAARVPKVTGGI